MAQWTIDALLSMFFAGITAILAKYGMQSVHADLALAVRTAVVFGAVLLLNSVNGRWNGISSLTGRDLLFLLASGLATTLSWIFYYRAMKEGPVSSVAVIDKASIVVTIVFAYFLFKEPVTMRTLAGAGLIVAGLFVLIGK